MYTPEIDLTNSFAVEMPDFKSLPKRVEAAMNSLRFLEAAVEVTEEDQVHAQELFSATMVQDKPISTIPNDNALSNAGTIVHLRLLLSEYDKQIVVNAAQIRNYVTNKLLEATSSTDEKIVLAALKLLGNITDVGLFTEKSEVSYTNKQPEELKQLIAEKLGKIIDMPTPTGYTDAGVEEHYTPITEGNNAR